MPATARTDVTPPPRAGSRHDRVRAARRRRARHRGTAALTAAIALLTALPAAAGAPLGGLTTLTQRGSAAADLAPSDGYAPDGLSADGRPADGLPVDEVPVVDLGGPGRTAGTLATVEDAESWCAYLSSFYLSFPSPWSARVINCRSTDLFVAPVYSDGGLGMCVLVPARHSRHLGGNVARWVTDIRLC